MNSAFFSLPGLPLKGKFIYQSLVPILRPSRFQCSQTELLKKAYPLHQQLKLRSSTRTFIS